MSGKRKPTQSEQRIRSLVADNIGSLRRALMRFGIPQSDLDDEVQRVLIIVSRRINDVEPGSERSFLIEVARNIAAHWRRSYSRRREFPSGPRFEAGTALGTPEDAALRKQAGVIFADILAAMPEALRSALIRFEFDQMDMHEIAADLGIPRGTVASRLRRARKFVQKSVAAIDLAWELGVDTAMQGDEPVLLRRLSLGALARALLESGASLPRPPAAGSKPGDPRPPRRPRGATRRRE